MTKCTFLPLLLAVLAAPAASQLSHVPRTYTVSGPAAGDVLNVRSSPSTRARDIGDLAVGTTPVEVLETNTDGRWGRILWQGGDGWISMRYLTPVQPTLIAGTGLPGGLSCSGTEPFWRLQVSASGDLRLEMLGAETPVVAKLSAAGESVNTRYPVALLAHAGTLALTAMVSPERCNDGMSDQTFGWSVDLLRHDEDVLNVLSGCCWMPMLGE